MSSEHHPSLEVRPATPDDAATIVEFVRLLAEFEHEPVEHVRLTADDVRRDGFGDAPAFEALIADLGGEAVGFALILPNYSTWEGRPGIYVEDVYVRDEQRGSGVSGAIMTAIARLAIERNTARSTSPYSTGTPHETSTNAWPCPTRTPGSPTAWTAPRSRRWAAEQAEASAKPQSPAQPLDETREFTL